MIDKILNLTDSDAWSYYSELCENPEQTQRKVLLDILEQAGECDFAQKYSFSDIADFDDFRKKIPISEWSDYSEISEALQKGSKNILFHGRPAFFIMTSGTSGSQKLIPETLNGAKAKSVTDKLRRCFTLGRYSEIMQGKILPLVNRADLGVTEAGIPFGTASGLTLMNTPEVFLKKCAFFPDVMKISNPDSLDYVFMRFALNEDVRMIIGNNAARMEKLVNIAEKYARQICDDIENGTLSDSIDLDSSLRVTLTEKLLPDPERAQFLKHILASGKKFTPSAYWSNMKVVCCWLSGSVGASVPAIKKLFSKDTVFLDYGYGASEGKFNIPHITGSSSGTVALHAAFYEFLPADRENSAGSAEKNDVSTFPTLLAHQLKKGGIYKLIITNYSGLYRYDMHDLIQVTGFYKNTPEIVFISKTGDVGNIAGEKLAGSTICAAAAAVAAKNAITIKYICAVTVDNPPHYIFCIELENEQMEIPADFAETLDKEICKDIGYGNKRRDNLLKRPELRIMKSGFLEKIYEEKTTAGLSRAQVKLPVIYNENDMIYFDDSKKELEW